MLHWWWWLPPPVVIIMAALECKKEKKNLLSCWGCVGINTLGVASVGMLLDAGGGMAAATAIVVVTDSQCWRDLGVKKKQ